MADAGLFDNSVPIWIKEPQTVEIGTNVTSIGGLCVYQLHRSEVGDDSRQRDEHRDFCVFRLQRPDVGDDPVECDEHRGKCVQ